MGKYTQPARTNTPLIRLLCMIAETDDIKLLLWELDNQYNFMGTGKSRNLYSIKAISRIAETEYIMGKAKPSGNAKNILSKIPIMGKGNAK